VELACQRAGGPPLVMKWGWPQAVDSGRNVLHQ
jgi:hypothetical protein